MTTPKEDNSNSIKSDGHSKSSTVSAKEYPKAFIHLRTPKGRAFWSSAPLTLVFISNIIDDGVNRFIIDFKRDLNDSVLASFLITALSFLVLTGLHVAIKKVYLDWNNSREVRLWTFGSICWIVSILIVILLFDPYDHSRFKYYDDDDLIHILSVMIVPLAFLSAVRWWYVRHIR